MINLKKYNYTKERFINWYSIKQSWNNQSNIVNEQKRHCIRSNKTGFKNLILIKISDEKLSI